jgi:hypothetical protein
MRSFIAAIFVLTVVFGLQPSTAGQRAPFASPPPGSGPTPMRPYGQSGGCSEEPVAFHRCAIEKMKTFNPPRTADGKPDFSGFWNRIVVRNMENIEEHPQTIDTSGGKSSIIDPADGKIPYQPWAAARRDEMFSTYVNPLALCTPLGSPKQAYGPGTFRVVQTPGYLFMLADFSHSYRIIPTDGRPHVSPAIHLYDGDSRGRWDGNTLVIDVTNQRDRQWLDAVGNFFSDSVHVVERFTMIDKDVLHYEATITDPNTYTRPWTMVSGWKRNNDQPLEIWENACWEGIQGELDNTFYGHKQYPGTAALPK